MKKTITGLVLTALIFAPSFASAASKATSQLSVQTSTDASSSINLKKMTKKQLQKLIKDAKKELASRKVKKVSTGSDDSQTSTASGMEVYKVEFESSSNMRSVYIWTSKELNEESVSAGGEKLSRTYKKNVGPDSCIRKSGENKCGGTVYRFNGKSLSAGGHTISFESVDGERETVRISVNEVESED